ncbi:MAG: outer membrane protein assembly factor BamD [Pseudomonadota bacterium]
MLKDSISGLFVILFLFSGCALDEKLRAKDERPPDQWIKAAIAELDNGRYHEAARTFNEIIEHYPYTEFASKATLKMADALFLAGEYLDAFYAYHKFEALCPTDPNLPYVIYKKGLCLFHDQDPSDRDQWKVRVARMQFGRLLRQFPGNDYALQGEDKIVACEKKLAQHELDVAYFYYKRGLYQAAMGRYQYAAENYPPYLPQHRVALEYLKKCRTHLNLPPPEPVIDQIAMPNPVSLEIEPPATGPPPPGPAIEQLTMTNPEPPTTAPPATTPGKDMFAGSAPSQEVTEGPNTSYLSPPPETVSVPPIKQPLVRPKEKPIKGKKKGLFTVQVGAFQLKRNAERLLSQLRRKGYMPFILNLSDKDDKQWYAVRLENFADMADALLKASQYREKERRLAIVTPVDSLPPISEGLHYPRR